MASDEMKERVKDTFVAMMRRSEEGVTTEEMKAQLTEAEFGELPGVINEMLAVNRIELFQREGMENSLTYKIRGDEEAAKVSELTNEQVLVWQVVTRSGNGGVWLRDIKNQTSLQQQTLNKALKVLEARKLVKTVKSVQQKTKKLYMAYELEPTREVSGGPWYTDQEFDHGFVEAMKKLIMRFIGEKGMATVEEVAAALSALGVTQVKLELGDVRLVVDSLVCDLKLEEVNAYQRSDADKSVGPPSRYKLARPSTDHNFLAQVPCGTCPVRASCSPTGLISPANCIYLDKWLAAEALPDVADWKKTGIL